MLPMSFNGFFRSVKCLLFPELTVSSAVEDLLSASLSEQNLGFSALKLAC